MTRRCPPALVLGLALAAAAPRADAQDMSRTYTDSRGKAIRFPRGDASFADEVVSFDASVLFDFNRSELRPEAQVRLAEAAARAASVRAFLLSQAELRGRAIAVEGFGASRPIASNASDAGRQQNRRVEILVTPN